jgi:peptide deformylase
MSEIITNPDLLRKNSVLVQPHELDETLKQVFDSIPDNCLGLSAPQIGLFKRLFVANLSSGHFAFVNPEIVWRSAEQVPSIESCLSLPNVVRCVNRYSQVSITADKIVKIRSLKIISPFEFNTNPEPLRLKGLDSFVFQHELDHLNGVLLTDHAKAETKEQKLHKKHLNRQKRKASHKTKVRSSVAKDGPKNPKKLEKIKEKKRNLLRAARKQEKIRVKIQEKSKAEKEGLFISNQASSNHALKPENEE